MSPNKNRALFIDRVMFMENKLGSKQLQQANSAANSCKKQTQQTAAASKLSSKLSSKQQQQANSAANSCSKKTQ